MTRRSAICAALTVILVLAALPRPAAAATDSVRSSAAPQLAAGELSLLARVVQAEAANQPVAGQEAVAWTAVNRLRAGGYGKTLTQVLQRPYQYARPKRRDPNSPAYRTALMAALMAVRGAGDDPSRGSTHFHVCKMRPTPRWARAMERRVTIQDHCFYRIKEPRHD
jgi:spore germination cell wall hydrolase CwlJ-like protein